MKISANPSFGLLTLFSPLAPTSNPSRQVLPGLNHEAEAGCSGARVGVRRAEDGRSLRSLPGLPLGSTWVGTGAGGSLTESGEHGDPSRCRSASHVLLPATSCWVCDGTRWVTPEQTTEDREDQRCPWGKHLSGRESPAR